MILSFSTELHEEAFGKKEEKLKNVWRLIELLDKVAGSFPVGQQSH